MRCAENAAGLCLGDVPEQAGTDERVTEPAMRFFFRILSLVALIVAILAATLDAVQSVSSSSVVLTSLGNRWQEFDVESLALVEELVRHYIHGSVWQTAVAPVLAQPAFAVFLVLALIFWMIGYQRPRFAGRFSA